MEEEGEIRETNRPWMRFHWDGSMLARVVLEERASSERSRGEVKAVI